MLSTSKRYCRYSVIDIFVQKPKTSMQDKYCCDFYTLFACCANMSSSSNFLCAQKKILNVWY